MPGPIAVLFFVVSLIAPSIWVKSLAVKYLSSLSRLEKGFLSLFLGQLFLVSLTFLFCLVFGLSWISVGAPLAVFIALDFLVYLERKKPRRPSMYFENYERAFLTTITLVSVCFLILLVRHMVPLNPDGLSTPHNTFGDIQYHIGIANSFYLGDNFPPQNPIYPGVHLAYPFMIDFNSAILEFIGMNLQLSLVLPGLVFGICFFAFFILFSFRFLKSVGGSLLSLLVFVFNGGLGGYLVLKDALSSANFLEAIPVQFSATIDKYNFRFPNAISSVFMAERPILIGMAAFFVVLLLLWVGFEKKKADIEFLLAGLLIGLLPLWHTHTLIALGLTVPFYFLAYWLYHKTSFARALRLFLPILYFSLPLGILGMSWHYSQVFGGGVHFFNLKTGWIVGPEGFWKFWLNNLGIFPLLLIAGFFVLDKKQKFFYFPAISILVAANFVNFQPFDWDNYKLLLVWYAVSSVVVGKLIYVLFSKARVIAFGIIFFLFISGMVLIIGDYLTFHGLFSSEDIELASWEETNTRPTDLILTGPQHNQFSLLAGRKILLGYPGYLWTQGIDSGSRSTDARKMYEGDMDLVKRYGVDYIVLGYEERRAYKPDEDYLNTNFILVKETTNFKIYKVI